MRSRELQDAIFNHRASSPLIFDWVYNPGAALEEQMNAGADQLVSCARLATCAEGGRRMKLVQDFNAFLNDTVNLNSTRSISSKAASKPSRRRCEGRTGSRPSLLRRARVLGPQDHHQTAAW